MSIPESFAVSEQLGNLLEVRSMQMMTRLRGALRPLGEREGAVLRIAGWPGGFISGKVFEAKDYHVQDIAPMSGQALDEIQQGGVYDRWQVRMEQAQVGETGLVTVRLAETNLTVKIWTLQTPYAQGANIFWPLEKPGAKIEYTPCQCFVMGGLMIADPEDFRWIMEKGIIIASASSVRGVVRVKAVAMPGEFFRQNRIGKQYQAMAADCHYPMNEAGWGTFSQELERARFHPETNTSPFLLVCYN